MKARLAPRGEHSGRRSGTITDRETRGSPGALEPEGPTEANRYGGWRTEVPRALSCPPLSGDPRRRLVPAAELTPSQGSTRPCATVSNREPRRREPQGRTPEDRGRGTPRTDHRGGD